MKKAISLALALMMLVCTWGCQSEGGKEETKHYSVGTASSGGLMYAIGSGWASLMNTELEGRYQFNSEETAGNTANIAMIESGEIEFCCNGTMSIYEGFQGEAEWTSGNTYNKMRVMFPLCQMVFTAYTLEENGITSLSDLNGKVVGLGSKGGAVDSVVRAMFDELGIVPADIYNDGWSATVSALADGTIDAGITMQQAPAAALVELQATKNVYFIPFSDAELDCLKRLNPALADGVIAAGSYDGLTGDIKTVGDIACICVSEDVPEDVVYELVKTTYENVEEMRVLHNAMSNWDISLASSMIALYHPGALKYYQEAGVTIPDATVVPKS